MQQHVIELQAHATVCQLSRLAYDTGRVGVCYWDGRRQRPSWCGWLLQVYAKEEELCELQVRLTERDAALKAHKTENSRFADMKDKFKADIAVLQQQVCAASSPCTRCTYIG